MATARLFYRAVAALACLGAIAAGWFFLGHRTGSGAASPAMVAWIVICVAQSLALASGLWTALGTGLGHVASVTILTIACNSLTILGQIATVLLGGGLVALAVTTAVGNVLTRLATIRFVSRRVPDITAARGRARREIGSELIKVSTKYWLTEIGALMLLRTDQYFIAAFSDLSKIPLYYAAGTLVSNLALLAIAIGDAANVYVSHLWRDDEPGRVHGLVLSQMRIGLGLMLCGAALLLVFGESIMAVWLGPGQFIGMPILATFCAMFTLFTQQSLMLGFSRATENEIYAGWYLAAGFLNLLLTWQLVQTLGLWGVALATLVAQLPTTSWYILSSGLVRLGISWRTYLAEVILPVAGLFLAACAVLGAVSALCWQASAPMRLLAGLASGGLVVLAGFWTIALDAPHRLAARQWLLRFR